VESKLPGGRSDDLMRRPEMQPAQPTLVQLIQGILDAVCALPYASGLLLAGVRLKQAARLASAVLIIASLFMSSRFNRPLSAEQINQILTMLRHGAQSHGADYAVSDLLYKAEHVIRLLWRECDLHDNLEETAAKTLSEVEKALADCLERQELGHAARALAEVNRLAALIDDPPEKV
jgi:hypothetical protein